MQSAVRGMVKGVNQFQPVKREKERRKKRKKWKREEEDERKNSPLACENLCLPL
jgi:hypothetical protein